MIWVVEKTTADATEHFAAQQPPPARDRVKTHLSAVFWAPPCEPNGPLLSANTRTFGPACGDREFWPHRHSNERDQTGRPRGQRSALRGPKFFSARPKRLAAPRYSSRRCRPADQTHIEAGLFRALDLQPEVFELRIGAAESEEKDRLCLLSVTPAITHQHTFGEALAP